MASETPKWTQASLYVHSGVQFELAQATSAPPFNRRPFMKTLTLLPWTAGAISSNTTLLEWLKDEREKNTCNSLGEDSDASSVNSSTSFTLAKQVPMVLLPEPHKWTVCAMPLY